MAFYPELKGAALDAHNRMLSKLKSEATSRLGLSENEVVVRPLRPQDLQLSNPVWEFSVTSTDSWNTIINGVTIADNRFVGVSGVTDASSTVLADQLKITREGSDARVWNIQAVNAQDDNTLYVDDPVTIDQNTTLTVKAYNSTTSTSSAYNLIFHGATAEKRGLVINP